MTRPSHARALVALSLASAASLSVVACGGSDVGGQSQPDSKGGASGSDAGATGGSAGGASSNAGGTNGGGAGGATGTGGSSGSTGGTNGGGAGGTTSGGAGGKGGVACGKSTCGAGEYCCDALCGTCAPMGAACVQGCAVDAGPPACATDSDCRVTAFYCTGCECLALASGQSLPKCNGPGVECFADPCQPKKAACVSGACVAVAK